MSEANMWLMLFPAVSLTIVGFGILLFTSWQSDREARKRK